MKIFVTGATGYIGSHLVKRLIREGHTVHALVRNRNKAAAILEDGLHLFDGHILDVDSIKAGMEDCDQVYHLAAYAKVWAKDSKTFYDINVQGTINILESAKSVGVKKLVITSTAGVFGPSMDLEVNEKFVRQKDFFNEYESSKSFSEGVIKDFVLNGMNAVIVNPTRVYGPYLFGEPEATTRLIDLYVRESLRIIPGPTDKIGNYVFIDDVVDGHVKAMKKGLAGQVYILGGQNHTFKSLFAELAIVSGVSRRMVALPIWFIYLIASVQLIGAILLNRDPLVTPKWVAKAKYHWRVSSEKAQKELGWTITPLSEGLMKTFTWAINRKSDQ